MEHMLKKVLVCTLGKLLTTEVQVETTSLPPRSAPLPLQPTPFPSSPSRRNLWDGRRRSLQCQIGQTYGMAQIVFRL